MNFKCAHCEKEIKGLSIVIDKTHIIHKSCEDSFEKEKNKLTIYDVTHGIFFHVKHKNSNFN